MLKPEYTARFSECVWFKPLEITVVGLGGVGRGVAETLFLQGHSLIVYDGDKVEPVNCIPQGYPKKYVSWNKSDAFYHQMSDFVGDVSKIRHYNQDWSTSNYLSNVVIAAADNWTVLRNLYEQWREIEGDLFISPGMLADMHSIQVFMKDDGKEWASGSDTESVPCTTKSSMYMAKLTHGRVVSIVNKFIIDPSLVDHEYRFNGILD